MRVPMAGFCLLLAALSSSAAGPAPQYSSPNGKWGFVTSPAAGKPTVDLVQLPGAKIISHLGSDCSAGWSVLWADDSKHFALMEKASPAQQSLAAFRESTNGFIALDLPKLPEAAIPDKLKHGKAYPDIAILNAATATEWKKDGSLLVDIQTMVDGKDSTLTATRTVLIKFDEAGHGTIAKSTIQYDNNND